MSWDLSTMTNEMTTGDIPFTCHRCHEEMPKAEKYAHRETCNPESWAGSKIPILPMDHEYRS